MTLLMILFLAFIIGIVFLLIGNNNYNFGWLELPGGVIALLSGIILFIALILYVFQLAEMTLLRLLIS